MQQDIEPSTGPVIRKAGVAQGITLVVAAFLPILAIVSLTSAVPTIVGHFKGQGDVAFLIPLMVSTPGLSIAILAPFAGIIADRFGRRRLLVWSTLLYGIFGSAPFFLDDLHAIIGSRLLLGIVEAAILTVVNTLIGDYWDQAGRRRWLVIQGVVGPVFATAVIAASGALTQIRWNAVFLIYLVALPIFVAMSLFIFEPHGDSAVARTQAAAAEAVREPFPYAIVVRFSLVTLFSASLYYVFIIQGGLAFQAVGVTSAARLGGLVSVASLAVPVGALLYGWLGRRPAALQIAVFLFLLGSGLAGIGLARDYRVMFAALLVQQLGAGMAVPLLVAWSQSHLPFQHRGRGMGAWTAAFFFGQFTSPIIVQGAKSVTGNVQGAFLIMGLCGVAGAAAALLALIGRRRPVCNDAPSSTLHQPELDRR